MFVLNAESKQVVGLRRIKNDFKTMTFIEFLRGEDAWPGDIVIGGGRAYKIVSSGWRSPCIRLEFIGEVK